MGKTHNTGEMLVIQKLEESKSELDNRPAEVKSQDHKYQMNFYIFFMDINS